MLRDQPYLADHETSVARQANRELPPPRRDRALVDWGRLDWFIWWARTQWALEVPDELHGQGVWRDYGESSVGASALGAPRYSDDFRRYLEGSAFLTDATGGDQDDPEAVYAKPMHAALARIAGRDPDSDWWYHASFLFQAAVAFFDWRAVAARALIPYPVQPIYAERVFTVWWTRYERAPARKLS